jgi:subtilase family serine protease
VPIPRKRAIFTQDVTGLTPIQVRKVYNIPEIGGFDGTGATIGLLEFSSGYSMTDVAAFAKQFLGLNSVNVHFVSVDGITNDDGESTNDMEATLDVEWALAMAPKATIYVYSLSAGDGSYSSFHEKLNAALQYVINLGKNAPSVLSISYGDSEQNFAIETMYAETEELLTQLANMGVSVFVSSGDQGVYGEHWLGDDKYRRVDFPAASPHAIAVGGTSLAVNPYLEKAWTFNGPQNGGATGGGFSYIWSAPGYQKSAIAKYGQTKRGVPDVAAIADPASGPVVIFEGQRQVVGGTSLACPIWAAITALIKAHLSLNVAPGDFTEILYQTGGSCCNDITEGNNSYDGVDGYEAGSGWDPCTGWGSPDAGKLFDLLKGNG